MSDQELAPGWEYRRHGRSLALYRPAAANADFWDDHWSQKDMAGRLASARKGRLGEMEPIVTRYLPRDGRVLEAGCGDGTVLAALRARGYDAEGIDYAERTVAALRAADPTLPVRRGDIFALDVPDGTYAGYVSIGVLEHNFDGYAGALREAHRVLRPGGVALISVPYLNFARRRLRDRLPEASGKVIDGGLSFYQDHIDVDEFSTQLQDAGFGIEARIPLVLYAGLTRDWTLGRWLHRRQFLSWRVRTMFLRACRRAPLPLRRVASHMMMFVCTR